MKIAIIPARGGSQRIQKKNIRDFMGWPIIAYSINTARESGLFNEVYVSTDSEEIGEVAMHYGAKVIGRDYGDGDDHIGTQQVMRGALKRIWSDSITEVCCIYPTAPMMTKDDLRRGYDALSRHAETQYTFAVAESPFGPAGWFYWGRASAFINNIPLVAEHSVMIPIPPERCIDINTPEDWDKAIKMYKSFKQEKI